jgi:hypothetical protein
MLNMKKLLLLFLTAVFAVTAMAQTSEETARELQGGENSWTLDAPGGYAYWYYTPAENTLLTITPSVGYTAVYTYDGEGDNATQVQLRSVYLSPQSIFSLESGRKYYIQAGGGTTVTFTAAMETGGNIGKGLSSADPMPIVVGEEAYMGSSIVGGSNLTSYATYTAGEDGVLELSLTTSVQVSVNGGAPTWAESVSSGKYVYKFSVENGQTYNLTFTHYGPFILTAVMTHPVEGSLDMPFTLVEGANTVPAGLDQTWYTFTNTSTGYGVISSEDALRMGSVKVYNSKYNIDNGLVYAGSETGSYNVRFEMPYTNTTYYVCVERREVENSGAFNFAVEDYKQGEKEDNPIILNDLTAPITTENAGGTYYYAVDIPASDHKFLNVEATSEITNTATSVAVYVQGNSYNATSGNASVRAEVNGGTSGQRYIIRWTSQETQPIEFTVSLEDIKKGDLISNPIEANLGLNTIDADGTRYYTYTPTKNCKLVLTTPKIETTASFSVYSYGYSPVTASNSGNVYSLSVTEGTQYYIQLNNAVADEKFTLAEAEFEQGDTRDNPVIVEDGKFTFGSETYGDYWLQYTADRAGKLVIECDVPFNYTERMQYGKSTDSYLSDMIMSSYDGSTSTTVYGAEVNAAAGDVFLVNLKMKAPHEGCVITFTIRDFEAGEAASTAIELTEDVAVVVPSVSRTAPMWYKVSLPEASKVTITADNFVSGYWYQGLESTTGSGEYMTFNYSYDEKTYVTTYTFTKEVAAAGDYYIMIDQCYGNTNMTFSVDTSSGIGSVDAGTAISLDGNTLNINVDNADVRVYTLSGAAVVSEKVSGNASFSLDKGIYIVKINNTVKKVIVR